MSQRLKHRLARPGLVNLLICLGSLLVIILGMEIILRMFFPLYFADNHGVYQFDEKLQTVPRKNLHLLRSKDYQEEYVTNTYGTANFQSNFPDYRYVVFALGDSYTQGIGLPADSSYPFQLDLLLNLEDNNYKPEYAVINLGFSSYGGEQYLLSLKEHMQIFGKPNFILVLGCSNDYDDDLRFKAFQNGKTYNLIEGNPRYDWLVRPLGFLAYETEIGKRIYWTIKNWQKQSYRQSDPAPRSRVVSTAEKEKYIYEEFNEISKEINARLIVSWANRDESYTWLKDWAAARGVAFADWQPAMNSVMRHIQGLPEGNQHSGGHYRTWVNGVIARSFGQQIRKYTPVKPVAVSGEESRQRR